MASRCAGSKIAGAAAIRRLRPVGPFNPARFIRGEFPIPQYLRANLAVGHNRIYGESPRPFGADRTQRNPPSPLSFEFSRFFSFLAMAAGSVEGFSTYISFGPPLVLRNRGQPPNRLLKKGTGTSRRREMAEDAENRLGASPLFQRSPKSNNSDPAFLRDDHACDLRTRPTANDADWNWHSQCFESARIRRLSARRAWRRNGFVPPPQPSVFAGRP